MNKILLTVMSIFLAYSLQAAKSDFSSDSIDVLTQKMIAQMQNCAKLTHAFNRSVTNFHSTHATPWKEKAAALNALRHSVALLDHLQCLPLTKSHVTGILHESVQRLAHSFPEHAPLFQNMREKTYGLHMQAVELEKDLPAAPGTLEFENRAKKNSDNLKAYIVAVKKLAEDFLSK